MTVVIGLAKILACLKTPSSQPKNTMESLTLENRIADPSVVSPVVILLKAGTPAVTISLLTLASLYNTTMISFLRGCR